jgi:hypothetical protein
MKHGEQKLIAAWVGISEGMMCQIFSGDKRPSPLAAAAMEERSGIDLRDWLFMSPEKLKLKVYFAWQMDKNSEAVK